jgi:phosphohistidine swiveling domain-containing protein/DNA-binding Lrp family transcriptional regulator
MAGLSHTGWQPVVNFAFDNQAVVGVPGKGCYVFYDAQQIRSDGVLKNIQDSIDTHPDFIHEFRRRTDEIFGVLFFKCQDIESENLSLLSNEELHRVYRGFIDAVMAAPLITVQLFGIEACFDDEYRIMRFLRSRLEELGKEGTLERYKGILSVNTGETVAFTEKKNFYQVLIKLGENPDVEELFLKRTPDEISLELRKYPSENLLLERHIRKYEWVNTEYVSGGWSREKWAEEFKRAFTDSVPPKEQLAMLLKSFEDLNAERREVIVELDPPKDVLHALVCLSEFIAQRDWTKGYFIRALSSYNILLDEIAQRMSRDREDVLNMSYLEVDDYFVSASLCDQEEIERRKRDGYVILIKGGVFELITGAERVQDAIQREGISDPFEKVENVTEMKGLGASRGMIRGKARVLEDASRISELKEGEILVTYMTTIEFIPAFRKAAAVVTDEGGMSCHAAIISREFKLPCVVGTKVATRVLKTGDEIEVDATNGAVRILCRTALSVEEA